MNEIEIIKKEIREIKERNKRVESDKEWETSSFRIFSITIITYILASIVLFIIGVQQPYLNSLIPTIGFFLSIQSMPFLKKWWINHNTKKVNLLQK